MSDEREQRLPVFVRAGDVRVGDWIELARGSWWLVTEVVAMDGRIGFRSESEGGHVGEPWPRLLASPVSVIRWSD